MLKRLFFTATALAGLSCWGQPYPRRAAITGGGPPDRGRCTVEVVVDGAAEVEIRGDNGVLRNISGAAPQWRRFDCTSAIPPNAADVRFAASGGRGRQELIRDMRNGGPAVVRIEDPESGSDTYSFELAWGREGAPASQGRERDYDRREGDRDRDRDSYYQERDEAFRGDWHARFFERVRQDLEHIQSVTFPVGPDQYRLVRTKQELNELQQSWASGNYDRRSLDDVITGMTRVLDDNRLSRRDRDVLTDDLNRLREFRERGGWRQ
jgi:hypothetical protein